MSPVTSRNGPGSDRLWCRCFGLGFRPEGPTLCVHAETPCHLAFVGWPDQCHSARRPVAGRRAARRARGPRRPAAPGIALRQPVDQARQRLAGRVPAGAVGAAVAVEVEASRRRVVGGQRRRRPGQPGQQAPPGGRREREEAFVGETDPRAERLAAARADQQVEPAGGPGGEGEVAGFVGAAAVGAGDHQGRQRPARGVDDLAPEPHAGHRRRRGGQREQEQRKQVSQHGGQYSERAAPASAALVDRFPGSAGCRVPVIGSFHGGTWPGSRSRTALRRPMPRCSPLPWWRVCASR